MRDALDVVFAPDQVEERLGGTLSLDAARRRRVLEECPAAVAAWHAEVEEAAAAAASCRTLSRRAEELMQKLRRGVGGGPLSRQPAPAKSPPGPAPELAAVSSVDAAAMVMVESESECAHLKAAAAKEAAGDTSADRPEPR